MHLIQSLATGFADATSGTVSIYRRGTSTRATYYSDFEGDSATTPTADIALDSAGRLIAYVNEPVTCTVYSNAGVAVAVFTACDSAPAVEVVNTSFTGVDYETAASAAGNPTTLDAVLTLWKTNNGAIDWKVLFDGAAVTVQTALGGLAGLVYNVRNPTYGATGDGATDDTAAITAAVTAANAAGGGIVWFPEGTYRTTSAITVSDKVSLAGPGAHCTTITVDHASAQVLTYSGSTTRVWQELFGLRILASQANSGYNISVASGTLLRINGCDIGSSNSNSRCISVATSATTLLLVTATKITMGANVASVCLTMDGAALRVKLVDCQFITPATVASGFMVSGRNIDIARCKFDFSATTSATLLYGYYATNDTTDATVTDCIFTADGGGSSTTVAIYIGQPTATAQFYESNNTFLCDTAYTYTISGSLFGQQVQLRSRELRCLDASNSAANYTAPTDQYGIIRVTSTYAGATTITAVQCPFGASSKIFVCNNSGGAYNYTPVAAPYISVAAANISNGSWNCLEGYGVSQYVAAAHTARIANRWYV